MKVGGEAQAICQINNDNCEKKVVPNIRVSVQTKLKDF